MFLSSYENRIDKKGRVSVPATFRSHLSSMGYNGFISYPSLIIQRLRLVLKIELKSYQTLLDSLNPFEKRDYFAPPQYYQKVKIYNLTQKEEISFQINYSITLK